MCLYFDYRITFIVLWIQTTASMSLVNKHSYFMDNSHVDSDVADFIIAKGYLPNDNDLHETSIVKNFDNDVTYLLSKLSDEDLIKLLNDQPKKNTYDLTDIVKVAVHKKPLQSNNKVLHFDETKQKAKSNSFENVYNPETRFKTVSAKNKAQAFFKLENKQVNPYSVKTEIDENYSTLQKINNLLYSRPFEDTMEKSAEDDEKKELLFDVLVKQLKTLCCKKSKQLKTRNLKKYQYQSLLNDIMPQDAYAQGNNDIRPDEYMFLIINDEIKNNGSDEMISVDPESLDRNSSVLLLGPITSPLSDNQLKSVMTRISNELSKPDYLPLLQQLADGTLSVNKTRIMKSLINGPETRRYIKPHRCNHQSPLAKVYGGPKWLICTGPQDDGTLVLDGVGLSTDHLEDTTD